MAQGPQASPPQPQPAPAGKLIAPGVPLAAPEGKDFAALEADTHSSARDLPKTSEPWRAVWSLRTGSTDRRTLERTLAATEGMESSTPHASSLATLDLARARRLPHDDELYKATQPGEITYVDVVSASHLDLPKSSDGKSLGLKHALVFVDGFSGHIRVYFAKTQADVPALTRFYLLELGTTLMFGSHFVLRRIHTDGGLSLNSEEFESILLKHGLAANVTSCPRTPASNGAAEAAIKALIHGTTQRLAVSGLGRHAWHWAMRHTAVSKNKLATRKHLGNYVTPHELFYRRQPSLRHAVIFGAPCSVLLLGPDREKKGKFGLPAEHGHILGHGEDGFQWQGTLRQAMGYIVLLSTRKIVFSKHVRIDERSLIEGGQHSPFSSPKTIPASAPLPGTESESEGEGEETGEGDDQGDEGDESPQNAIALSFDPLRRDRASRSKSQQQAQQGGIVRVANPAVFHGNSVKVPRTYKEALSSPHAEQWRESMASHLRMHAEQGTWRERVVPMSDRVLPIQWVFDVKTNTDNEVVKWKSRTVLFGNLQRKGIDYQEVFSPTVRAEQVRLLIAIGAQCQGDSRRQFAGVKVSVLSKGDVVDAYLNSELKEPVLSQLPPGYIPTTKAPPGFKVVAENIKAHPGLRQAGRCWFENHRDRLIERGFSPCPSAPCIFVKRLQDGEWLGLGNFVDDLISLNATSNPLAIQELFDDLRVHYEVKFQSTLEKFLGAEFETLPQGIFMHLNQYVTGILERFGMADCRPAATPESSSKEDSTPEPDETLLNRADTQSFQEVTGALMFCSTTCRPDLAHAVNKLTRRMSVPRVCDLHAARRVLRYLQGTKRLGLLFKFARDAEFPHLVAYADADWANDPDGRRSMSGNIILFNNAPISWYSGLQTVVALSSTESEYISLATAATEITYLRELTSFLQRPAQAPTTLFEDNQGAIHLVENPVHHKRTKHIDVRFHYIRLAQEQGIVKVVKIHTDLNKADIFTKATTATTFQRHVNAIMFRHDLPHSAGEGGC